MTFEELCERAFKRQELGEFANIAEKYAYLRMSVLFDDYRNAKINKGDAAKQKQEVKREYETYQKKIDDYWELCRKQNEVRVQYGQYIIDIEKATDQFELLDKSLLFIEKMISDDSFRSRNIKKVDN